MQRELHGDKAHPEVAASLHELGVVSREGGDLAAARRYVEESLNMMREVHGDKAHPEVAASLHELGIVSRDGGDLAAAGRYVEESLKMYRELHGEPPVLGGESIDAPLQPLRPFALRLVLGRELSDAPRQSGVLRRRHGGAFRQCQSLIWFKFLGILQ